MREPDTVDLQPMTELWLRDARAIGDLGHQGIEIVAGLLVELLGVGRDNAGKQQPTEPRSGLDREASTADCDTPCRGDRPRVKDFELGKNHHVTVLGAPALTVGTRHDRLSGTTRLPTSRTTQVVRRHNTPAAARRQENMSNRPTQLPDRNLAMELVRTTEAAALAAARWMGRGDKIGGDGAAVDAMRIVLQSVPMDGIVVIGEGEKDEAPMLYNGELIGDGNPPQTDIAVDPIDGTTLTALGRGGAIAVIAVSPRGTMFDPGPCVYMEKMAAGPEAAHVIDITKSATENIEAVAEAMGKDPRDVTAVILDRDRHGDLIAEVRATGARIRLIPDGDVAGAIATADPNTGADILIGIGGTPEGVISAAALKCMGGEIQGRLWPRNEKEKAASIAAGYDLERVLTANDLVDSDDVFFAATGITDGDLLRGVRFNRSGAITDSLVMRSKSGTVRRDTAQHNLDKLATYSSVEY